jgi:hypothetical protein
MNFLRRGAGIAAAGVAVLALAGFSSGVAVAEPTPVASIQNLTGVSTSVALDKGFVSALTSLQVTPSPAGTATVKDGVAAFPITGGNVTVYKPGEVTPYVQGMLMHNGSGLELTKGDTTVQLDNFVIDPGIPSTLTGRVQANGQVIAPSVKLFDLDGNTLQPITTDPTAGTATLTGTTVYLSAEAATALNGAFKTDAIKDQTTVGIATIVVKLPGQGQQTPQMQQMPSGGVSTGGGSTAGIEYGGLLAGGAVLLVGAGAAAYTVRRRVAATSKQ